MGQKVLVSLTEEGCTSPTVEGVIEMCKLEKS